MRRVVGVFHFCPNRSLQLRRLSARTTTPPLCHVVTTRPHDPSVYPRPSGLTDLLSWSGARQSRLFFSSPMDGQNVLDKPNPFSTSIGNRATVIIWRPYLHFFMASDTPFGWDFVGGPVFVKMGLKVYGLTLRQHLDRLPRTNMQMDNSAASRKCSSYIPTTCFLAKPQPCHGSSSESSALMFHLVEHKFSILLHFFQCSRARSTASPQGAMGQDLDFPNHGSARDATNLLGGRVRRVQVWPRSCLFSFQKTT